MTSAPDVIWLRPESATSGRPATLRRSAIVAAAVRLADRVGIEAITMRMVAGELGTGPATLYRHLRTRDDLVDLMGDHAASLYRLPPASGDGVADLVAVAEEVRRVMLLHPWLPTLAQVGNRVGPHQLDVIEHVLALLEQVPGSPADHLQLFTVTVGLTSMWVLQEVGYREDTAQFSWMTHVISTGQHPRLTEAMVQVRRRDRDTEDLRRMLQAVINGIIADQTGAARPQMS